MKDIDGYRLGNLVIFKNEYTKAKIVKVTQIEYIDNMIFYIQINNYNSISKKEIKPVQLYVESLVDLKFYISSNYKKDNSGNIVKVDYEEIIYRHSKGSIELKIRKSDDTIWYKKKQIHYIHQLQNLCSDITGEPFTISEFYESHFTKSFFDYINL